MSIYQQTIEQNCIISIESDDIEKIKQHLSSGYLNVNSILTSRHKIWDSNSLSILAIASYSGSMNIVTFLVQRKVCINQTDRLKQRTALHWAAVSGNYEVCRVLIEAGAIVNAFDRDSITPLIFAVNSGNANIVKLLIKNGAKVDIADRLRCTPLHYACAHFHSNIARDIIINGCIANSSFSHMFGGTPFKFLVFDKQYHIARVLVESGCNLSHEKWILDEKEFTIGTKQDEDFINWLRSYVKRPPKLINLCRKYVRSNLGGQHMIEKIKKLNVPLFLKDYLMLKF